MSPTPQPPPPVTTPGMLRASRLFAGMSEATLELLAGELKCEMANPGQMLIAEGEIATHMFVVLSGEVEVLHKGGLDHDVRVALLGPGDWVGEMAILGVQPRSATVRAVSPSLLLRMTREDLETHLVARDPKEYAQILFNIASELSRRLRVADRLIAGASASVAREYVKKTRG